MPRANELIICPYCKKQVNLITYAHLRYVHNKTKDQCMSEFPLIPYRHYEGSKIKKSDVYLSLVDTLANNVEVTEDMRIALIPQLDDDLDLYLKKYGTLRGSNLGNGFSPNATTTPMLGPMKDRVETREQRKIDMDNPKEYKTEPRDKRELERRTKRELIIAQEIQNRMTKEARLELERIQIQKTIDEFIADNGIDYLGQCTMMLIEDILSRKHAGKDVPPNEKINLIEYVNKLFNDKISEVS